jgi:predicted TPR repeat methyltransferase
MTEQNSKYLYSQSLASAEAGDLDKAEQQLKHALTLEPNNVMYQLLLANFYKTRGLLQEACELLLRVTEAHPDSAAAFNNLGTVYFAQHQFQEAITCYEKALHLQPDYLDAYYNLGLALNKQRRYSEAMNTYQALIDMSPEHNAGRFQLACLFMQQFKYKDAINLFAEIEKSLPFHFETKTNLATCYLRLHDLAAAKAKYLQALELSPEDTQILFNLGIISAHQGRTQEAIHYYLQVLKDDPDFFPAHNNLGIAYLTLKDKQAALLHFRAALKSQPNNAAIKHTINILTQSGDLSFSPPEYVRELFDAYADHYEQHLSQALHYDVPHLMFAAMQKFAANKKWDILDLGCGTGLCGEYFKKYANSLIGVDLSAKMLEIAEQKGIYTELHDADILAFLIKQDKHYDLIMAGDVLVYFGDLQPLFTKVKNALNKDAYFIFTTEISYEQNFILHDSGRFAHSKKYLQELAAKLKFAIISMEEINLRMQESESIKGYLCVWRS